MKIPARFANEYDAKRRYPELVEALVPRLFHGDPLGDAAVAALAALGAGPMHKLVMDVTSGHEVPQAPTALLALARDTSAVPPWFDADLANLGARAFMRAGRLAGTVLGSASIVMGYASPAGNKPLALSGRLTEHAARRLAETSKFVLLVCSPDGSRPFAPGHAAAVRVRLMHAHVRRMLLASPRYDAESWGVPINQHDMVGTLLLFSIVVIEGLRKLGFSMTTLEAEGYFLLWRYIGQVMGVDPEIIPRSIPEAVRLGDFIDLTQHPPDRDAKALTRALLDSPFQVASSAKSRRNAELQSTVGAAFTRALLGDERADALDVPRSPFRSIIPPLFAAASARQQLTRLWPNLARADEVRGMAYWEEVVRMGNAGGYDFAPFALRL
jgi:hypothetical protein